MSDLVIDAKSRSSGTPSYIVPPAVRWAQRSTHPREEISPTVGTAHKSDLYDTDIVAWVEEQTALLRRLEAGERVNDQIDWGNVIEEIESVGREERRAVGSALMRGIQHKLYLLGWPNSMSARHWEIEVRAFLLDAAADFRESMRLGIDLTRLYRQALLGVERHMLDEGPPAVALPDVCPWTLDELLAEGDAAFS